MSGAARKLARSLRRQSAREYAQLKKAAATATARQYALIHLMPMAEAVFDHEHGEFATKALAVAYDGATGGERTECLCCGEPWTLERVPVAFVRVDLLQLRKSVIGGVCPACSGHGVRERVMATVNEYFGLSEVPAAYIGAGGRA